GIEAGNLVWGNLLMKEDTSQILSTHPFLEGGNLCPPSNEEESDVTPTTQSLSEPQEHVHSLCDTHIAGIDKYLLAGERCSGNRNTAAFRTGSGEPIVQYLQALTRAARPRGEIGCVPRSLYADDIGQRILVTRDGTKIAVWKAAAHQSHVSRPLGK